MTEDRNQSFRSDHTIQNHRRPGPLAFLRKEEDRLFAGQAYPKPFEFNREVAEVFDDMVLRSIPLYVEVLDVLSLMLKHHLPKPLRIVDVGSSTGTAIAFLAQMFDTPIHFIGIEPAAAMREQAEEKCRAFAGQHQIEFVGMSVQDYDFSGVDAVIMNYTLQFIPVKDRLEVLSRIASGLKPGGLLFLSEKVRFRDPLAQELATSTYERFKARNGYSRHEIERKKEALENVLVSLSSEEQTAMLKEAGFASAVPVLQWVNFTSWLAFPNHSQDRARG